MMLRLSLSISHELSFESIHQGFQIIANRAKTFVGLESWDILYMWMESRWHNHAQSPSWVVYIDPHLEVHLVPGIPAAIALNWFESRTAIV